MTDGIHLHALGGIGPNLLLIHGFGADRMTWLANQDALQLCSNVFVCDLPAHGDQPPVEGTPAISAIVDELIAALIPHGRFFLVGHSLGGAIAMEIAARRPDLITGLALLAPAGLGKCIDRDFLDRFPVLSDLDSALALLRRLVVRPRLITPQIAQRVLAHLNQPRIRSALRALGCELAEVDNSVKSYLTCVAASEIPRLAIWGEDDQVNPLDRSKLAMFNSAIITLPDTGHLPHIESSKAVNKHLTTFLQAFSHQTTPEQSVVGLGG